MNTIQQSIPITTGRSNQESSLLDMISKWPDWKIQALGLDESDLQIKETIQAWRLDTNTNLNHF